MDAHPRGLDKDTVLKLIHQLCLSIHCCHSNDIIHRDIKPENLLVNSDMKLKLCDFGK